MYTAPDQVACWYKAARMTDTEDMELPEREPPLACLAGYAAEAEAAKLGLFNERGRLHAAPAALGAPLGGLVRVPDAMKPGSQCVKTR